ncbi:TPA: phage replisome organizer, partial [Enterococcus faecalis]|nr:phage replisome organizer [Enterococcus faecalis]
HLRLAEKLKNNLINDFPSEMKKVKIEKWADVFRLIEERDQQTIAAIDYVLDWLPTNSFWFGNIRSASKLRTQFEKLKFEIKNEKERGQQRATYQRQNVRTESLPEWAKEPNNQQEEKLSPEKQAELDKQIKEFMEGK